MTIPKDVLERLREILGPEAAEAAAGFYPSGPETAEERQARERRATDETAHYRRLSDLADKLLAGGFGSEARAAAAAVLAKGRTLRALEACAGFAREAERRALAARSKPRG